MSFKKRGENLRHIGEALGQWAEKLKLDQGLKHAEILALWEEFAGRELHRSTRKIEIRQSILYASMTDSTSRHELLMRKSEILEQLNRALPEDQAIREIRAF